jgi:sugar lactone lactonase YvrE
MRRALFLAMVFLLLSAAPAHALNVVVVDLAITNSTPVTLSLTDSDNGGGGSCWSDISADCVSGPPAEIDPGATVHVYVANDQLLPDVQGHVTYQGANTQAGFFHSGVTLDFHNPPTTPSTLTCDSILYFNCSGLTFDPHGVLQGSTSVVATDICPGSIAGPCEWTADAEWGSEGSANGDFEGPTGLSLDMHPFVYVVDTGNNRVQMFDNDGTWLTSFGSAGTGNGQFQEPLGVAANPYEPMTADGDVYVISSLNGVVQRFARFGDFIGSWSGGQNPFNLPTGAAVAPSGDVWVTDTNNNVVDAFSADGAFKSNLGGTQFGAFTTPRGIAIASDGTVYVVDSGNNRVQFFDQTGQGLGVFGSLGGALGELNAPWGVAVVPSGSVAVTDPGNGRVDVFSSSGAALTAFGVPGSDAGEFQNPQGIAADAAGNIYVADNGNNRVQKFSRSSNLVTIVGRPAVGAARRAVPRRVRIALRCAAPGKRRCGGLLTLHNRRGLLGRRRFSIRTARKATMSLPLSRAARSRLRRGRGVFGLLLAHVRQPNGLAHVTHGKRVLLRAHR